MSLQGSIETFALPDVLGLLAITRKTGELRVTSGALEGSLWVVDGQLVQSVVGGRTKKAVDAVFELLRLTSGTFSFAADEKPSSPGAPEAVDKVLAQAHAALAEWREISKVVPDLDAFVAMAAEPPGPQVTVTAEQWKLLVSLAGGRSVRDVMGIRGSGEFEMLKAVKGLVDARLVTVNAAQPPKVAADDAGEPAARPRQESAATAPASDAPAGAAQAPGTPVSQDSRRGGRPGGPEEAAPSRHGWSVGAPAGRSSAPTPAPATAHAAPAPAAGPETDSAPTPSTADAQALVAQLAALAGDDEEVVAEKVAAHLADGGELPVVADASEPINRGLLLKFLSSVRS